MFYVVSKCMSFVIINWWSYPQRMWQCAHIVLQNCCRFTADSFDFSALVNTYSEVSCSVGSSQWERNSSTNNHSVKMQQHIPLVWALAAVGVTAADDKSQPPSKKVHESIVVGSICCVSFLFRNFRFLHFVFKFWNLFCKKYQYVIMFKRRPILLIWVGSGSVVSQP